MAILQEILEISLLLILRGFCRTSILLIASHFTDFALSLLSSSEIPNGCQLKTEVPYEISNLPAFEIRFA